MATSLALVPKEIHEPPRKIDRERVERQLWIIRVFYTHAW